MRYDTFPKLASKHFQVPCLLDQVLVPFIFIVTSLRMSIPRVACGPPNVLMAHPAFTCILHDTPGLSVTSALTANGSSGRD